MLQIYYLPDGQLVEAGEAFTLLDASLQAGIPHTHICGGNARCSTCRVLITEGQEYCGTQTIAEQEMAWRLGFPDSVRLACRTTLTGSGKISIHRLSLEVALFVHLVLSGTAIFSEEEGQIGSIL